jgi:hypothetical protein
MSNNTKFILGLMVLLVVMLGIFWVLPNVIFSNGQKNPVRVERPYIPGTDTSRPEPVKQEIKQVFERRWNFPLDSCNGSFPDFWQIKFDPLPEVNKPSKIYVKLKSCWDWEVKPEEVNSPSARGPVLSIRSVSKSSLDYTQLDHQWLPPIKKGDVYEGVATIIPWDVGRYVMNVVGIEVYFDFNESGKLIHLSDREFDSYPVLLPNHPLITDKEVYVKFNGQYVTNLFHIVPPLSFGDTSTVNYIVVPKVDYPEGLKLITHNGRNIDFKMMPGPISKGDTLLGSFKVVPPHVGHNSIDLGIEEPPKEGVKPKNDNFTAQYNLLEDGKLLFMVKNQKEYNIFFKYYKNKGVQVGEY